MAVLLHAADDDGAIENVRRGEERRLPVALVLVRHGSALAGQFRLVMTLAPLTQTTIAIGPLPAFNLSKTRFHGFVLGLLCLILYLHLLTIIMVFLWERLI